MWFYFLLIFVVLFTSIGLIVLFGDLPNYKGTIFNKLYLLIVKKITPTIVAKIELIDAKYFHNYLTSERTKNNVRYVCGWLTPALYLIILTRCISFFFEYTYAQILILEKLSNSSTNWRYRLWCVIIPIIIFNYTSFFLAVFCDAGHIDKFNDNPIMELEFPHDRLIYFQNLKCSTCHIIKPARSKHCSICKKCILMFDHHCVWLNNDVGYYTYRWFLFFLASLCLIFIYGGYLCYYSLHLSLMIQEEISNSIKNSSSISQYWRLIKTTSFANEISGILLLLCIFLFPLVAFFLCEHLRYIYLGVTTNETGKWDYVNELVKNDLLYEFIPNDGSMSTFLILNDKLPDGSFQFLKLQDERLFSIHRGGAVKKIKDWDDMNNIYDRGFWRNLSQRIFPIKF